MPVEKAYLYGSYARGEENEESDIDILLVSELFDKMMIKRSEKPGELASLLMSGLNLIQLVGKDF